MRYFPGVRPLVILLTMATLFLARPGGADGAVRHHFYVGTVVTISNSSLTIHSKTHQANFTFTIDKGTVFLRKGLAISRNLFKVGSYVTVSYSPGARNTLIAWHISLRK